MRRKQIAPVFILVLLVVTALPGRPQPVGRSAFPDGWHPAAPRPEIRPAISFEPEGGPDQSGAFVIATDGGVGQHGWVQKTVPVTGGKTYRFLVRRKTTQVDCPRRSTPAGCGRSPRGSSRTAMRTGSVRKK